MNEEDEIFDHPSRFPKNAPGPFYTIGDQYDDGSWCGRCLSCGVPEAEAPSLLAKLADSNGDTYFLKQPVSDEEIKQACRAVEVCCVDALRYGGRDERIIRRLGPEYCDFEIVRGETRLRINSKRRWWQFWKRDE